MIKVQEMVRQMRLTDARGKPRAFSLLVCTANRQKKTGGRILDLPKVRLLTKKRQSERYLQVQPLGTKDVVKLHLDLILYFNNQEVV
ncbi:hypothetical protein G8759_25175 [Spirosoma aureum]|uniref:Uncharacterized protein n=1 Tax=Spirosoma aureum TaxID=2692134 RepID=A0A6G9ATN7_9BACT|nr:hypothetical protein [Spirosoma aureum]QIP15689.1 hypothetical protein G8759_25175 [Spirosoma aureum]